MCSFVQSSKPLHYKIQATTSDILVIKIILLLVLVIVTKISLMTTLSFTVLCVNVYYQATGSVRYSSLFTTMGGKYNETKTNKQKRIHLLIYETTRTLLV